MANILYAQDPFRPQAKPIHYEINEPDNIENILVHHGLLANGSRIKPFIVSVDGNYILQDQWGMVLSQKHILLIVELPPYLQGGGGGSDPLKLVLQVALIAAALYVPGLLGLEGFMAGALSAGIMLAGGLLINALLPTPVVGAAGDSSRQPKDQYLIGSQNNQARLRAPIPVLYGRRRFYPDLAMAPYVETSGNNIFLYQLFCLTQGKMEIEQICIEKTPIGSFSEVSYKVFQPNERMDFFPDNVYTSPEVADFTLNPLSNNTLQWRGGFIVTPNGQYTNKLSVDISLPRGLANINQDGDPTLHFLSCYVQARALDDSNSPVGNWFTIGDHKLNLATVDPVLQTYFYSVPMGRYELRMARRTEVGAGYGGNPSKYLEELHWVGARSYMFNKARYGNVTMLAVKIRATNNINNNIARRINVLGTRILPVFNGADWVEQKTRSIAWAVADVFRNQIYGRKLRDKRINLQELLRLDQIFESRGDQCDAIFADDTTTWDAASRIVECGRTKPVYYAGVIDFCRNEKKLIPSAMFTPQNMVKDSFSIEFSFPKSDEADFVIIEYTDPVSWQPKQVECFLPDSPKRKPLVIQMLGITSRQQAWREGIHRAAIQRVQRQFTNFKTEMEGLIPRYGDKLLITHDVPEWGASGAIESIEGNLIHVSESLPWSENNVIALRAQDGSVQGFFKITKIDEFSGLIEGTPFVSDGYSEEPTHYIFGTVEQVGSEVLMIGAVPDESNRVAISCINYSDYPYDAENELPMPIEILPTDPIEEVLVITWINVQPVFGSTVFDVSCNVARGATRYEFELYTNEWRSLYSGANTVFSETLPTGIEIKIRARAVGSYVGEWFIRTLIIENGEVKWRG